MEKWIVVYTAVYASEVSVLQAFLSLHDIDNRLRDDHTTQAQPFYSVAIGGVKVEVPEEQAERAFALLHEAGYSTTHPGTEDPEAAYYRSKQAEVRLRRGIRITAIIAVIAVALAFIFLFKEETPDLTGQDWCVSLVEWKGKYYVPETLHDGIAIIVLGCEESIGFQEDGTVSLPGFQSPSVNALWRYTDDGVEIYEASDFASVYEGGYEIDYAGRSIKFISDNTVIEAGEWEFPHP
ncbi:MAG: hypothetical protein ACK5XQ_03705 [Flavobacteriales bacterium]